MSKSSNDKYDASELIRRFEALETPPGEFEHEDHVHLGWAYLSLLPSAEALPRFSTALRRFAEFHGANDKYHETITWAYMLLINERRGRTKEGQGWGEFAQENPDLLTYRPSLLDRYYQAETLSSDLARRVFVMPDVLTGLGERQ